MCRNISGDHVLNAISRGSEAVRKVFVSHDELTLQRRTHMVFHGFREPAMAPGTPSSVVLCARVGTRVPLCAAHPLMCARLQASFRRTRRSKTIRRRTWILATLPGLGGCPLLPTHRMPSPSHSFSFDAAAAHPPLQTNLPDLVQGAAVQRRPGQGPRARVR